MADNSKHKNSHSSILFYIYLIGFIAYILFGPNPNYRRYGGGSARYKVCYSNLRILQGALEMYNMDVDPMMTTLDQSLLREGHYIKANEDLVCPEKSKHATYSGEHLTEDGEIICSYHGGLIAKGPYNDEEIEREKQEYFKGYIDKIPYALAWPALLAIIGFNIIIYR